ncbi:MAG: stage II sporulation protein D [Firmicutes bacterium]|nr:stage II sporulation protein D [Bacillota bacterium]
MKKNILTHVHLLSASKTGTRKRRRRQPLSFAPILLILSAALFILVAMPFTLTSIFTPESSPAPVRDKAEKAPPVSDSKPDKQVQVPQTIKVYRQSKGTVETIAFEDYVKGVVASEMPSVFEPEALKAQAVAARTYSMAKYQNAQKNGYSSSHSSAPVCDTVHCQVYQSKKDLKTSKGGSWMKKDWKKISKAVNQTKGQLMYYKGELVAQALFHSSSGGKTENCEDVFTAAVPYLVSVESPYEEEATHKKETLTLTLSDFAQKMRGAYPSKSFGSLHSSNVAIKTRSKGGRVETMRIGNATLSGKQVREALGLYSANFTVSLSQNSITFTTTGSGHGVGMSQYGANGMAKRGYDYKEILSHYYSGITVYPSSQ